METPKNKEHEPKLELVRPSVDYKDSFVEAAKGFHLEGRDLDADVENPNFDFDKYLEEIDLKSRGINLSEGQVPTSIFWLVDNDGYIGTARLRHQLNEKLLQRNGNIGYQIRADKRDLGYGTKILELALEKAKEIGLEKVLLTCNKDNAASRKIIEKHGGIMENEYETEGDRGGLITIQRFWINLKKDEK